ncbi:bifunctional diaminohydroxyphosphoribosylaminopyrimidine deaminase/5-amino-6-(5-phosphoribosylamino)uracil reductase RibD [Demequina sp. NBRC 110056]|uniref:bifunctional diaminohydroxyphosphoribosylaminopyrimidine deaminase/5-amino-6-(5-phosphoribosylamino)uracil reductase RibD n=1 Tax=Demequina sp. NBRC 110056 TaxID=1570345 RepID=UPI000A0498C5|nr:bifunctional diaminohydroxyphosphoribosylaminopyrimidine deaminase/5-amino-6-(5-phosphoribosylamino)uracil reductase RibD [Demequina sp. NBRC 110056]
MPDDARARARDDAPGAVTEASPGPLTAAEGMDRAVALARRGPAYGPNPRVGCVLLAADGTVLGEGWHRGAGTPHAEVAAIADAAARGSDIAGATAVVTLEPCAHTGRTGPCVDALTQASIGTVVYAVADPGDASSGGGEVLRGRGIRATLVPHEGAHALNRRWLAAMRAHRPYVIAKWASTLDGRMAAADGTSFWITGEEAREHAHRVRASVDAIAVGTGTVMIDDPSLTARPGGKQADHQPLRVVVGHTDTTGKRVWEGGGAVAIDSRDPHEILAQLWAREVRTLIVEGGPTLLSAFLRAGLVDELNAYIAPALLGAGPSVVDDLGIGTMADSLRGQAVTSERLGADTLVTALLTEGV